MKEGHCPLDCVTMSDLCGQKYRFLLLTDSKVWDWFTVVSQNWYPEGKIIFRKKLRAD
jgi:hypothetical protein